MLCLLVSLAFRVYGAEQKSLIKNDGFDGIKNKTAFSWEGNHTTFNISCTGKMNYTGALWTEHMSIGGNENMSIYCTPKNSDCIVTITHFELVCGNPNILSTDIYVNNSKYGNMRGWAVDYQIAGNANANSSNPIVIKASRTLDIYSIELKYTVKAKAPTPKDDNVYVTINPSDKQTIDVRSLFSMADPAPDFTYTYEVYGNYGNVVHLDGNTFWAEAAGDYKVRARVNAGDDHEESAWSYATIHVKKWPNTLFVHGSEAYHPTMELSSTIENVWLTASNTDYANYPISCTQLTGADIVSYNATTGVVTSGAVLGMGTWHISQPESPYFLAGENDFTVSVVNHTFIFYNTTGDQDWETLANWGSGLLPSEKDNVHVRGDLIVASEKTMYMMSIENGAVVTVGPDGGLTLGAGGIEGATTENLVLQASQTGNNKGKTGYLRISPLYTGNMPEATVQLFSVAYLDYDNRTGNSAKWQYVGSPLAATDIMAKTVYAKSWIYSWSESEDDWSNQRASLKFAPFVGYATTQKTNADGVLLTYKGQLVSNQGEVNIDLAYSGEGKGHNMVANSFAAPIDVTRFAVSDYVNAEATIYLFNTGSQADESKKTDGLDGAGQYVSLAVNTLPVLRSQFGLSLPTTIASMQGFYVNATGEDAQLTLDYSRLVWSGDYAANGNRPLRIKACIPSEEEEQPIEGALQVTLTAGGMCDQLYMLESQQYNGGFENGNDAHKFENEGLNLFALDGEDRLAVVATDDMTGTRIGLRTGEETIYTMKFSHLLSARDLLLHDAETEQNIEIAEGAEYTFVAAPNMLIADRFTIVEAGGQGHSGSATGCENRTVAVQAQKFIRNGQLYILKNGLLYNAQGVVVR